MLASKPRSFHMEQHHKLSSNIRDPIPDPGQYKRLIGHLIYLLITRPDITYPIHILSQFMQDSRQGHWVLGLYLTLF